MWGWIVVAQAVDAAAVGATRARSLVDALRTLSARGRAPCLSIAYFLLAWLRGSSSSLLATPRFLLIDLLITLHQYQVLAGISNPHVNIFTEGDKQSGKMGNFGKDHSGKPQEKLELL